jgi:hypothetical protein
VRRGELVRCTAGHLWIVNGRWQGHPGWVRIHAPGDTYLWREQAKMLTPVEN